VREERFEIRFGGSGGQGIITAAVVVAEAAAVYEGRYVCQTQSYGPEARGGKCKAEVVISNREIDYPKIIGLDMLLVMNQEACDAYFTDFKPQGLLLADATLVKHLPTNRVVAIPFTRIAREKTGKDLTANMVAVGALAHFCPAVSMASMEQAVLARVPAKTWELNRTAFHEGVAAAQKFDLNALPPSIFPPGEDEEEV